MSGGAARPTRGAEHDCVLLIAFGGPTAPEDVRPFIANVLRGRPVPPERGAEVVRHYEAIGGRSPLNEITLRQADALRTALAASGLALPVYAGMRNWRPYLAEALAAMQSDGCRRAVGVIMAAQQSDASWGRYQQDVAVAREALGPAAPAVDFAPAWHAHPLFVDAVVAQTRDALATLPGERPAGARLIFTAHSLPTALAAGQPYETQFRETAALVARRLGFDAHELAYQSRSGSPREPWLEPDVRAVIRDVAAAGARDVVLVPVGFVCDNVELLYDLDVEARRVAADAGVGFVRAAPVNDHPSFIAMLADVVCKHIGR